MSLEEKTDFPVIDTKELGKLIRIRRKQIKLNQGELAKRVEITQAYLSCIETNHRVLKNIDLLEKISKELEIPASYLIILATKPDEKYEKEIETMQNIIKGKYFSII